MGIEPLQHSRRRRVLFRKAGVVLRACQKVCGLETKRTFLSQEVVTLVKIGTQLLDQRRGFCVLGEKPGAVLCPG